MDYRFRLVLAALLVLQPAQESERPPDGPFGLSRVTTPDGRPADIDHFYVSSDCALCHPRQWSELNGSMHSVSHTDPLYRAFAELAREEAGEEVYTYCSGCHSPAGVVSGLIPRLHDPQLPEQAKAGVTCDVCHQVSALNGEDGPWGEPGNASLILSAGRTKYGPSDDVARNPAHVGESRDFFAKSEFCASCHTVIHPTNGLRIEHTYDEWKRSVYAERGIQCQDCHMRSVEDAIVVARTLEPVTEMGAWAIKGEERPIHRHFFVGGNVDAEVLAGRRKHAEMAAKRLKSAATLTLETPEVARVGETLALDVVVTNVGAGHSLPTSLTELREMWVHLRVADADGEILFESGDLDSQGEICEGSIRFGSQTVDAEGRITYKPWEAVEFSWKRLVPAKGSERDTVQVAIPSGTPGPLSVEARLLYRSAPPHVLHLVMGKEAHEPTITEMATAGTQISLQ